MSNQNLHPNIEDEISLKDMVDFLVESWKAIILTGLLGLVGSIAFLWVTPNQYQATAQVQVAQIPSISDRKDNGNNLLGVNLEDPGLVMARLKLPTTYSDQEIKACGFESSAAPSEALAASLKLSQVNGAGSIIMLQINRDNKETAIACVRSLFEKIKASQNEILNPYIEDAKTRLVKYKDRLTKLQSPLAPPDKSEAFLGAIFVARQAEVRNISEEIFRLNSFIALTEIKQAKLVSPIFSSHNPVTPKKGKALIAGLFGGLILGFLLMIGKRVFVSYRAANLF